MSRHTDEHLNWWGDRFCQAGMAAQMPFQLFMAMPVSVRERELAYHQASRAAEAVADQALPATTELHDQHLVDPMRPTTRKWARPWFFAGRSRRQQFLNRRRHGR